MNLKTNNDLIKNFSNFFSKDELKRIDDIILYIRSSDYSSKVQEELLYDILIMLKDAKQDGKSIDEVIGSDDRIFLEEVFKNIPHKKQGIMYFISYALADLGIIHLLYLGFKNDFSNILNSEFYLSELLIYPFIFFSVLFIIKFIHKTVYTKRKNLIFSIIIEIFLGLIFFTLIFSKNPEFNYNLTSKFLIPTILTFFVFGYVLHKRKS